MNSNIPDWMVDDEDYKLSKSSKDKFIFKSTLSILSVLRKVRNESNKTEKNMEYISLRMFLVLTLILLSVCSRNIYFPILIIVCILVRISFMSGDSIRKILKGLFTAEIISALILLPAFVFYKDYYSCISILLKICVSVTLIKILSVETRCNTVTASLKRFKVPDILILILDITLKYIAILGDISLDMLNALKLRSVGKYKNNYKSLSGITGTIFIKSKEMSEEMYQAMECRGFSGEYKVPKVKLKKSIAVLYYIFIVFAVLLFIYMEAELK